MNVEHENEPAGPCILVSALEAKERLESIIHSQNPIQKVLPVHALEELPSTIAAVDTSIATLICFNTGIIIPAHILQRLGRPAYNFHAAPPAYPGRDPHHWAVYEEATRYGVTAHVMTEKIDAGPIVAVDSFNIVRGIDPQALRTMAINQLFHLFERTVGQMLFGPLNQKWCHPARTRKQLFALCDMRGLSDKEIKRRQFAFQGFDAHFQQ